MSVGEHMPKFLCFNITTAAAIVGMAQLLCVAIIISNAATIYDRAEYWREYARDQDPSLSPSQWQQKLNLNVTAGEKAFVEISLANTIALHVVWLVALILFAAAFKCYYAVLVIPNLVMQILALVWNILGIAIMAEGLSKSKDKYDAAKAKNPPLSTDNEQAAIALFATSLTVTVVCFLFEIVFLLVVVRFYRYLKDHHAMIFPTISVPMTSTFVEERA